MGIDLGAPLFIKYASLRYFKPGEHHVKRYCTDNVLLLVFDGVLRFSEDGVEQTVRAGEYFIQKKNTYQSSFAPSDSPKYLYVHFDGEWSDEGDTLPYRGDFNYSLLGELIEKIDNASHKKTVYAELQYLFLKLILSLKKKTVKSEEALRFSKFIDENIDKISSLTDICNEFHYSKNYVIRIFNREFGITPIQYVNNVRIERATYLIETTSLPIEEISERCGYSDYAYFYRRFVQKNGICPVAWRRKMQSNPLSM